jgi:hypothetical protein
MPTISVVRSATRSDDRKQPRSGASQKGRAKEAGTRDGQGDDAKGFGPNSTLRIGRDAP